MLKHFCLLAALGAVASAHTMVTNFIYNGKNETTCVRYAQSTDPVIDLASDAMACNVVKGNGKTKATIKAGDQVAFEWRTDPGYDDADYPLKDGKIPVGLIDDSHKGPCAVYAKRVSNSLTDPGAGDGWFKIGEDGVKDGQFCITRLRLANAPQTVKIPTSIPPGDYLLRPELLTLNNAGPTERQPQFYVACIQVTIEGAGTAKPATVAIPGYVNLTTPGLLFDMWNNPDTAYPTPLPGPSLFVDSGPGNSPRSEVPMTNTTTTALKPEPKNTTTTAPEPEPKNSEPEDNEPEDNEPEDNEPKDNESKDKTKGRGRKSKGRKPHTISTWNMDRR